MTTERETGVTHLQAGEHQGSVATVQKLEARKDPSLEPSEGTRPGQPFALELPASRTEIINVSSEPPRLWYLAMATLGSHLPTQGFRGCKSQAQLLQDGGSNVNVSMARNSCPSVQVILEAKTSQPLPLTSDQHKGIRWDHKKRHNYAE